MAEPEGVRQLLQSKLTALSWAKHSQTYTSSIAWVSCLYHAPYDSEYTYPHQSS